MIGAAVAFTGFAPLNSIGDRLHVSADPWRLLLLPPVVLCLATAVVSWWNPAPSRSLPVLAKIGGAALLLGGFLSLLQTPSPTTSAVYLTLAVLVPVALFTLVRGSHLRSEVLIGGFLAANAALLIRADYVFLQQYGLPTGHALFEAKFSNAPYDFHYYGLQNPDTFATYLLLPLTISAFWAHRRGLNLSERVLLVASGLLCLLTLVMAYIRLDLAVGVVVVVLALASAPLSRFARVVAVCVVLASAGVFVSGSTTSSYVSALTQSGRGASLSVRVKSIGDGLSAMVHHPLTGVGIGTYAPRGVPAHSSVAQAGAEMGVLGLVGLCALTAWLAWDAWKTGWRGTESGAREAAALAIGIYAVVAALSGGARLGLSLGYVDVWALTVALLAGALYAHAVPRGSEVAATEGVKVGGPLALASALQTRFGEHHLAALVSAAVLAIGALGVATLHSVGSTVQRPHPLRAHVVADAPTISPRRSVPQTGAGDLTVSSQSLTWQFDSGSTSGWTLVPGTSIEAAQNAIRVTTSGSGQTYQLIGPLINLLPGTYDLNVRGSVKRGGLSAALLNVTTQKFTGNPIVSGPARAFNLATKLKVKRPLAIRVILSDDRRPSRRRSVWLLESVALRVAGSAE